MRCAILVVAAVLAAGCGNGSDCLPAVASAAPCPSSTIVDTSVSDPICLSASGLPLCRGSDEADCYICSGSQFDDNCLVRAPQQTIECVHKCSNC